MLALIDGDIITHRVGFTTENDPVGIAYFRCDEMLDNILMETDAKEYRIFLSDSAANNFRYKVDPLYKANRTAPKPVHMEALKEHLIRIWGARIAHGMEADDALGIHQNERSVVCSIDKDLLQIPGAHYNFVKKVWAAVSEEEGLLSFYRSILTGDVADNIKGIYGVGPAKAAKILPKWVDEKTTIEAIVSAYMVALYKERFGKLANQIYEGLEDEAKDVVRRNGRLLKIKQSEDEPLWDSVFLDQTEGFQSQSTQKQQVVTTQSTEHTTPAPEKTGFLLHGTPKDTSGEMDTQPSST